MGNVVQLDEYRAITKQREDSAERITYLCRRCGAGSFVLLPGGEVYCAECEAPILNLHVDALPVGGDITINAQGQYYKRQPDGRNMLCNADGTRSIFDDVDE